MLPSSFKYFKSILLTSCITISLSNFVWGTEKWQTDWNVPFPPQTTKLKAWQASFIGWAEDQKRIGNPIVKDHYKGPLTIGDFCRNYEVRIQQYKNSMLEKFSASEDNIKLQEALAIEQKARKKAEQEKLREVDEKQQALDQAKKELEERLKAQADTLHAQAAQERADRERVEALERERKAHQDHLAAQEKADKERLEALERNKKAQEEKFLAQAAQGKADKERLEALEKAQKANQERIIAEAEKERLEREKKQVELKHQAELEALRQEFEAKKQETVVSFLSQGKSLQELISKLKYHTFDPQQEVLNELAALTTSIEDIKLHDQELEKDKIIPCLKGYLTFQKTPVNVQVFDLTIAFILGLEENVRDFSFRYLSEDYFQNQKDISKGVKSALYSFAKKDNPSFYICKEAIEETAGQLRQSRVNASELGTIIHSLGRTLAPNTKTRYLESLIKVGEDSGGGTIIQDLWGLVSNTTDKSFKQACNILRQKFYQLALILTNGVKKPTPLPKIEDEEMPEIQFKALTLMNGHALTNEEFVKQLGYDNDNHLLEKLSSLESLEEKDQFIKSYEKDKGAIEKRRKDLLDDLDKKIQFKQKIKEKLTQFRHLPLLKDLCLKITEVFEQKIKLLSDTRESISRILSVVEEAKFSTTHREEIHIIQNFFKTLEVSQVINDFKVSFEKLIPHDHLYKTLGRIQTAISFHGNFLETLKELKDIWPSTYTDEDIVILKNKNFVRKIIESYLLEGENYLSLPSQQRAVLYQHTLKVLGEDENLESLTPAIRKVLLKSHDAYKKSRDAIIKIRPEGNIKGVGDASSDIYLIKGFEFTSSVSADSLQREELLTDGIPVPPPPPDFPLSPKAPPFPGVPKAPPPPPGLLGAKPVAKSLTPWQQEKLELQNWLDFYKVIVKNIETSITASEAKSKFLQQEATKKAIDKFYHTLEEIIKASLSHFDSPPINFEQVKEKLEVLFPQPSSSI